MSMTAALDALARRRVVFRTSRSAVRAIVIRFFSERQASGSMIGDMRTERRSSQAARGRQSSHSLRISKPASPRAFGKEGRLCPTG
jgi:hypothetical protein